MQPRGLYGSGPGQVISFLQVMLHQVGLCGTRGGLLQWCWYPLLVVRNLSEGVKQTWRDFVKALQCDPAEHLGSVKRDGET